MSTYEPPSFPRRPKVPSMLGEAKYQAQLLHYRYEINTGLYVMSPGEKLAFNIFNLALVTLLLSAIYFWMPLCVVHGLQRAISCLVGDFGRKGHPYEIHDTIIRGRLPNEAFASLAHGAAATNATIAMPSIL